MTEGDKGFILMATGLIIINCGNNVKAGFIVGIVTAACGFVIILKALRNDKS